LGITLLVFQCIGFGANLDISLYGGFNNAAHSSVTFSNASISYGIDDGKYSVNGWEGESFESPIYYGYRLSVNGLENTDLEFAVDFNHSKVKAKNLPGNLERLEFTDGINTLTLLALYKIDSLVVKNTELDPYVGVGIGIAYPHVDVEGAAGTEGKTYDYQRTGPAYQVMAGLRYYLAESWKTFAEYRITYTPMKADLDGGGQIKTDILNNQVSVGVIYSFQ
jgi:lipid A oxidase